ncbi:zincin-like metallopeptidase domain-containing protein [Neisseriaceae bacterium ESL0693]|nr:zincin-like metallopeptidase domain-containing protein [Neisseriaceae bacterium ESL0693]
MAMSKDEAEKVTRSFLTDYPGAGVLAYKLRKNVSELYGPNSKMVPKSMKGAYLPNKTIASDGQTYQGRVDIVLENADHAKDLLITLRHEVIGHYGMNTFAPEEKRHLLDGIIAGREEPTLKPLWEKINKHYANISLDMRAEEVLALQSERVEPHQHIGNDMVQQQAQKSFNETCLSRVRPMGVDDLQNIVCMVAQGLHDRTRTQKTFPTTDPQFRKDNVKDEAKKPFHEVVAEKLIEQLKAGTAPWQIPWNPGSPNSIMPMNPTTGKRYKGINAIYLMAQGRDDLRWMTYKQASAVGAQVRKGEKGTTVQYWKFNEERDKLDDQGRPMRDEEGKKIKEIVIFERPRVFYSTVFNGEQIDGLPPQQIKPAEEQKWNIIDRAENILQASGAKIVHTGVDRAFYRVSHDLIALPEKSQFDSADRYYATALHELGHWTGHPSRLDRDLAHPFGSRGYAKEELRAEISSMMLGDELGIGHDPGQHAAYVGSWIKVLHDEPMEIFRASSDAEKIFDYVMAFEQVQIQQEEKELTVKDIPADKEIQKDTETQSAMAIPTQQKGEREYINVPFKEKDQAKKLGARWDRQQQSWYVPAGIDIALFTKWAKSTDTSVPDVSQNNNKPAQERQYLAVPYAERGEAKAAGALWDKTVKSWYVGPRADMAKLERWNPDKIAIQQEPTMTPREEFAQAMLSAGLFVGHRSDGDHPIMDGKKHRVPVEGGRPGTLDGFYVGHMDGHPAGRIINNKTGTDITWKSKGYALSSEEKAKLQAEAATKLAKRERDQEQAHEVAAERVGRQMATLTPIKQPTPYLENKGIKPQIGVLTDKEGQKTYIPVFDTNGKQWAMQYIQEDGTKRFAKDSKKEGCFHAVGGMDALATVPAIVISEGYATAASNSEALGFATVAAFDSGNLPHVARALHEKYPDKPIIIAGDDDKAQELERGYNPGRAKAEEAAKAVGGKAVFPIFAPGEQVSNPKGFTDFNDLATKSELGREGVERQINAAVSKVLVDVDQHKKEQKIVQEQRHEKKQRPKRVARI